MEKQHSRDSARTTTTTTTGAPTGPPPSPSGRYRHMGKKFQLTALIRQLESHPALRSRLTKRKTPRKIGPDGLGGSRALLARRPRWSGGGHAQDFQIKRGIRTDQQCRSHRGAGRALPAAATRSGADPAGEAGGAAASGRGRRRASVGGRSAPVLFSDGRSRRSVLDSLPRIGYESGRTILPFFSSSSSSSSIFSSSPYSPPPSPPSLLPLLLLVLLTSSLKHLRALSKAKPRKINTLEYPAKSLLSLVPSCTVVV